MKRRNFLTLAAASALAAPALAQAPTRVTYMLPAPANLPAFAPHMIANHKGYFRAEGLEINFVSGQGGADVATQVGAGNAELGGGIGDTSMLVRPNGVPVRAVALLGGGGLHQIFIRADSGIENPAGLRGKTVAVQAYQDTSYYAFLGALARLGMTRNDVNAQAVGPGGMIQMVGTNAAPAMVGVIDFAVAVEAQGVRLNWFPIRELFPSMAQTVLSSDNVIRQRPQVVRGAVKAILKALGEIIANPAAATDDYLAAVPANAARREQMARVIEAYTRYVYAGQQQLGRFNPQELQQLQEFYTRENIIRRATPLEELYTNEFAG